jgi:AraC-like DNA-binding protein
MRAPGPAGLADLAVGCGYYGQAHLAREFRTLAGCPPTQWLAEEFRTVLAMLARANRASAEHTAGRHPAATGPVPPS